MTARGFGYAGAAALLLAAPAPLLAHSFGRIYNLPVPFWLYAWGAAAALIASFFVVGYFVTAGGGDRLTGRLEVTGSAPLGLARRLHLLALCRLLSIAGLALCMVTGLWGTKSLYGNFNMTFFWILFILGFTYMTALIGDLYALINPWRVIADGIRKIIRNYGSGVVRYPERLGYWPALIFYMAFIWIELFGKTDPFSLAVILSVYSLINLAGIGLIGLRDWFRYCEFLSLFLRLVARMAPIEIIADADGSDVTRVRLRAPFAGLVQSPAENMGMVVFILFMLSSTAFDGLRETIVWQRLFWVELYQWKLEEFVGTNPFAAFPLASRIFLYWQSVWLLLSPFIYFGVFMLFIWLTRLVTGSTMSLATLARHFAPTLLPIVLVYNITHYYTLIQSQGVKIIVLASDPFGWGWNLFGTAKWLQRTIIPDAGTVWHVQVGLIVLGHIVSVYLAHVVALRIFPTHRQAVASQIPMLCLMVIFTVAGLWILSQPVRAGA